MPYLLKSLRPARIVLLAAVLAMPSTLMAAQSQSHVFNLYIRGFKAGTISTAAKKTATNYALAGSVKPSAFLRLLRDVGFKGTASGRYSGTSYHPAKYTRNIKTGSDTSTVKMRFRNGRPIVESYLPGREKRSYDIDPAAQRGAIDLLSALHSVFEDTNLAGLCNRTIHMFDGRRRSKLTLSKPKNSNGNTSCAGKYSRVAGFSPRDMQKRVNFPFTLVYDQLDDETYRLMSFHAETTFGSAKAVRK